MSNKKLTKGFVVELLQACLKNRKVLDTTVKHVKYQFLYDEIQKKVFRYLIESYTVTGKVPTIGIIGQQFSTDIDTINFLSSVKKIVLEQEDYDSLLDTLEDFIKDSRFRILYDRLGDLYNEGKQEEAIKLLALESQEIEKFKLTNGKLTTVFRDYQGRNDNRQQAKDLSLMDKLTFGIHELDEYTYGGFNKGTSALFLGRSGAGKSTFLRWVGLCNARLGRRVVHFQAEGTESECLDAYDAGWTSVNLKDIEFGAIGQNKKEKIHKAQRDILAGGGEIYVYASESFDSMSIEEARKILKDLEAEIGPIDLAIFDYLELFTTIGNFSGESGERRRREAIANKITNIAVEMKIGTIAATQAQDLAPEKMNNEDFVYTRHHISEFKNVLKPFSYFITHNQTEDEYENGTARLYCDKFRKYKSGQRISFYQSRENSRYYDAMRTLKHFYHKG